jgi:hypothetical protein
MCIVNGRYEILQRRILFSGVRLVFLGRKLGEVRFGQVRAFILVVLGVHCLTSKPMSSIRPAEPFNVCRYFSVAGTQDAVAVIRKTAWAGSLRRYSWEGSVSPIKCSAWPLNFRARRLLRSRKQARSPSLCRANTPGHSLRRSIQRGQSERGAPAFNT